MDEVPDEFLVVGALLGDLEAFDVLVVRYRPAVVRTARSIVGAQDAEDVAQEAFLLAFKALPSLEDPAKFGGWLSAITRNFAYRFSRRERTRSAHRAVLDDLLLETVPALTQAPAVPDDAGHMLSRLPAGYALVLQLHLIDEMPLKRIAAFLGISPATAKWRVFRGKQLLRGELGNIRGSRHGKRTGNKTTD